MRRTPNLAEDLVPIAEFKTHASQLLRRLRESRRPVVITQHGRAAAVVLAPDDYEALGVALDIREKIATSERRAEREGTRSAEEVRARAKARLRRARAAR